MLIADISDTYTDLVTTVFSDGGNRGGAGPALCETGLEAIEVSAAVQQGRGVMPAGIVRGQEQADVVAYVVAISSPAQ